ncbi:hypothetical protein U1Q18_005308 [Sarracenia purpurea var. burkii]
MSTSTTLHKPFVGTIKIGLELPPDLMNKPITKPINRRTISQSNAHIPLAPTATTSTKPPVPTRGQSSGIAQGESITASVAGLHRHFDSLE